MLNRIVIIGRLTRDPELTQTQSGISVAKFTVAVDRKFNKDETDFIPVVVWRGLAENVAKYCGKGSLVAVDGRLQVRSYENQEGRTVWVTEVVAEDVRFLDSKGKSSEQQEQGDPFQGQGKPINISDDDLPF